MRVRVEGIVQGVGFRPFVYALADRLGLAGIVGNDTSGVFIEAEGESGAIDEFVSELGGQPPVLARVDRVSTEEVAARGDVGFFIVASPAEGERVVLVAPDAATCADCLRELADPGDRRFGYPFINCTNCGPRFTIVQRTPYDRPHTTMAGFAMCTACAAEYADPADRRFHAQPVCCPDCGPRLALVDRDGRDLGPDPLQLTVKMLREGAILAIKGLGGYHLAVDAGNEDAVARLRARKHREERPFALMAADLASARELAEVSAVEAELLTSVGRPIVVLSRAPEAAVADSVAPRSPSLGVMIPYTPLHHLLMQAYQDPIVLTSGNLSDEPIAYTDSDAQERLAVLADAVLTHDRAIHTRVDDSVARVVRGRPLPIRRSRGYVPRPITLPWTFSRHVLACGPELKNTFCLGRDRNAFVSHHIGDLENFETLQSFTDGIEHLTGLFDVRPEVVAYDLHPEYLSTKYALDLRGVELIGVQHHHAHVVSCLADNGVDGPVIGVAFDGLGWGEDGTLWGGEFLLADRARYERVAHLTPVPMPGGAMAVRQPWRMAAAHVQAVAEAGVNAPMTSSMGRLFDAVAALLDVRDTVNFEGQAAIELEHLVDPREAGAYT
ncbi:MAG: carbamoyltransferase HypF, partial [Mycobacteriales bacterium]